jgi:DNA-binding NtrC family response regulator
MRFKGNVRELKNVVERAVVLSRSETIDGGDLFLASSPAHTMNSSPRVSGQNLKALERDLILQTLESSGGNRTRAALLLGISVRTLRNKLKEYGYLKRENCSG